MQNAFGRTHGFAIAHALSLRLCLSSSFGGGHASGSLRLDIINSTVNIDARLVKLYELLENDILASLSGAAAACAPYKVCFPLF